MKSSLVMSSLLLSAACGSSAQAQTPPPPAAAAVSVVKTKERPSRAETAAAVPPIVGAKAIHYGEHDVVRLKAKLRYTTLIVLPKNEQILDFTCGDKEFWIVNGTQNFAYIKPAKVNSQTNLNLITASGNVYSFVLTEVSETPGVEPDLKVFVEPKEDSMISAMSGAPNFVSASQVEDYRQQVELAKEEAREAKRNAQAAIDREVDKYRAEYPRGLKFTYRFDGGKKPFLVTAMYHDEKFTYIQASAQETPALYEIKDGKPNLVNFELHNGTYVVGKVLDSGYFAIGKSRMNFTRQE